MRLWAGGIFAMAVLAVAVPELSEGLKQLGVFTLAIGAPLCALFYLRIPQWLHSLALAGLVAAIGLGEAAGLSGWWAALSLPLGILAWDLAHTARQLDRFEMKARRRFAIHYLVRGAVYGAIGFGLIGFALQAHWSMSFGPAVLLAFGAVISALLIVRQLWPRPKRGQRNAPSAPQEASRDGWRSHPSDE